MESLWNWSIDPANGPTIAGIGLWLSLGSTILGVVAFWVAIVQLVKVKKAVVAAKKAAEEMAKKVDSYSVVEDCARAEAALDKIQRNISDKQWSVVSDIYQDIISIFLKLANANASLPEEIRMQAEKATIDMTKICEGIMRALDEDPGRLKISRQLMPIRNFREITTRATLFMKREI